MKRLIILSCILAGACSAMLAQEVMPTILPADHHAPEGMMLSTTARMPQMPVVDMEAEIPAAPESVVPQVLPTLRSVNSTNALAATEELPGYLNPEGTLFLGVDAKGAGSWFRSGGVIGAWSTKTPEWIWRNNTTGAYTSVKYETYFSTQNPSMCEDENYFVDAQGNFHDSIVAAGGLEEAYAMGENGDAGYSWQMAVPLQTVTRADGRTQKFMLFNSSFSPTTSSCGIAAGGLPSGGSSDGLWPLTNAVFCSREGISFDLIASVGEDEEVHYFYGSSTLLDEQNTSIKHQPQAIITHYDKPQGKLYVRSISIALGADGYSAFNQSVLHFESLHVDVLDKNGNVIAQSDADMSNLSTLSYKPGKLLTFKFERYSDYDELLSEGFVVNDEFTVKLTGMQPTDAFGIYSAKSSLYASKSSVLCEDGKERGFNYDPYIMLNGIYPTMEDYYAKQGVETGAIGDTIPIAFNTAQNVHYKYAASYANSDFSGAQQFAFYSTFAPYDLTTRYWNFDIERPAYVMLSADYETNLGDDEDPVTIWDYMRVYTMYVYATERPKLGDIIKFGKFGGEVVMKVTRVDNETTALEGVNTVVKADKVIRDGQVLVRRNGVLYNMFGTVVE